MAGRTGKRLETTLAAAVSHPVRSKCLVILAERTASPAEIARRLKLDVSYVGYHVTALAKAGLIEKVDERPVRGAVEHFYRARDLPVISGEQEAELGPDERRVWAETILSLFAAAAAESLDKGTFVERTDRHVTRLTMDLDEQGWTKAADAYMRLYEEIFDIGKDAQSRMRKSNEKSPIRAVSFQCLFEVPPLSSDNPGSN